MQSLDYILEVIKTKEEHELIRLKDILEMVQRWKRNPALYLEPIFLNGNLTFKNAHKMEESEPHKVKGGKRVNRTYNRTGPDVPTLPCVEREYIRAKKQA